MKRKRCLSSELCPSTRRQGMAAVCSDPTLGTRSESCKGKPQAKAKEAVFGEVTYAVRQPFLWSWVGQTVNSNGSPIICRGKWDWSFESQGSNPLSNAPEFFPQVQTVLRGRLWLPRRKEKMAEGAGWAVRNPSESLKMLETNRAGYWVSTYNRKRKIHLNVSSCHHQLIPLPKGRAVSYIFFSCCLTSWCPGPSCVTVTTVVIAIIYYVLHMCTFCTLSYLTFSAV